MDEWLYYGFYGLAGFIGILIGWFLARLRYLKLVLSEVQNSRTTGEELAAAKKQVEWLSEEQKKIQSQLSSNTHTSLDLERKLSALQTEKESYIQQIAQHKEEVAASQNLLKEQFTNLATQILNENSNQFHKSAEQNMNALLQPLKERIGEFQQRVNEIYGDESRERFALKKEIERMVKTTSEITEQTNNLTSALRGDVKAQGNWGEVVLERILESSGLRENEEYVTQGRDLGLKDASGKRQQPDVIINLPDNKHIIIDAKVSLTHYERLMSTEDPEERKALLKLFVSSIYGHIDILNSKQYHLSEKLVTPEFVLLFFPIEGAFSLALQEDPQIYSAAWQKSIVIVSPTTLLATLRTIASIWKQEKQNKNAQKIAMESGRLYDKFVGFIGDLDKVGDQLKKTESVYEAAMNKLHLGRGSIITKVENIKQLGAKAAKQISVDHLQ